MPQRTSHVDADADPRADFYALLARLLLSAPDAALLAALGAAGPIVAAGEFALEQAWLQLTRDAAAADAAAIAAEFALLFADSDADSDADTGPPRLAPSARFYPGPGADDAAPARLRADLAGLGLARAPHAGAPDDHLGMLCRAMALLAGAAQPSPAAQKRFFETWLRPWYAACLRDVAGDGGAVFYRSVAVFADAFLSIEAQAFALLDGDDGAAVSGE